MPIPENGSFLVEEQITASIQEFIGPWTFVEDENNRITGVTLDERTIFLPGTRELNIFGGTLKRLDNRLVRLSEDERFGTTVDRRKEIIVEARDLAGQVGLPFQPDVLMQFHKQFIDAINKDREQPPPIREVIQTVVFDKRR